MRGVIAAALIGGIVVGFFIGRNTAPSVVINDPTGSSFASSRIRYPYVSMELDLEPTKTDDKVTLLKLKLAYYNRGTSEASDLHFSWQLKGETDSIDSNNVLPAGESRAVIITLSGNKAADIFDFLTSKSGQMNCKAIYRDLSGAEYSIDYEWKGMDASNELHGAPPRVKLGGEYLKFKRS